MGAIPWIGQDIVELIWGGFSVNNATLNRFFALHFVLPFVLAALAVMHLIALHDRSGSSNPLGISGVADRLAFAPYFLFKDLITIFIFIFVLSVFVFFMPNALGDSENYVPANPMQTPAAIVPEWYLLPFYAILRSIPQKLLGVIFMFAAILVLLALPILDTSNLRGLQFKPIGKLIFWVFVANFLALMVLGAKHVETPYIEIGQFCTFLYFAWFILLVPVSGIIEKVISSYRPSVAEGFSSKPLYQGGSVKPRNKVSRNDRKYSTVSTNSDSTLILQRAWCCASR
jgi:ubiquinol-cytochrome c reductase cytochrome b subunit